MWIVWYNFKELTDTLKHILGTQNMNPYYGKVILRKQILLLGVNYMGIMFYFGYQIVEHKVIRKYPAPKNKPPNKE